MKTRSIAAAFCVVLAGCSGGDGGSGAKMGTVTLSVTGPASVVGIEVYTHEEDGSLEDVYVTDSSGELVLDVRVGGMVTVAYLGGASDLFLRTIAGVQDGDDLRVGFGTASSIVSTPVIVLDSSLSAAEEYFVDAGNSGVYIPGNELSIALPIRSTCVNAANTYDLLATAIGEDFNAFAWSLLEDVPVTATTAFMPAWSTGGLSKPISLVNGPVGYFGAQADLVDEGGQFDLGVDAYVEIEEDGSANAALVIPSNFGIALSTFYYLADFSGPGVTPLSYRFGRSPTIANAESLDFTTDFYPYLEFADFDGSVPAVEFTGAPTDADMISLSVNWDEGDHYVFWSMYFPPDRTVSVSAPEIPTGPSTPSSDPYYLSLDFYDYSYIDGYDALRNGTFTSPGNDYVIRATGMQ